MANYKLLSTISLCILQAIASASAADDDLLRIPTETIDKYQVTTVTKTNDGHDYKILRASGHLFKFRTEIIEGHILVPNPKDASLRLKHYANPRLKVDLTTFKSEDFGADFSAEALQTYLQGVQEQFPPDQNFEILEAPEVTTGAAKFRFLGRRALTLRYQYTIDDVSLTRAENWFEIDGLIHMIAIEGPSQYFDSYFESIRIPFNISAPLK